MKATVILLVVLSATLLPNIFARWRKRKCDETGLRAVVAQHAALITKQAARLQAAESELQSIKKELASKPNQPVLCGDRGSTFVRWGRNSCPGKSTPVYVGVAGGKFYNHKGSGNNRLCLTRAPQYDNVSKPAGFGLVYGAEYQNIPGHHDHNVPCSVCRVPQSTTIMVPGTLTCPSGWASQYTGHLAAERNTHVASEYVCLDGDPENDDKGVRNEDGLLFYYVLSECGSLPCPPYISHKVVTCVVCSK